MSRAPSHQTKKAKPRASKSTSAKTAAPPAARPRQSVSPSDNQHILIAKRAYELYSDRGYRHGFALEDWLDAEREILSRLPPP